MFLNYLKLSFRLLARNPFFTFIDITGLAVGFAFFFILWQYTYSELRSDQFVKDHDRIYRFHFAFKSGPSGFHDTGISEPEIARRIAEETPEIESYSRIFLFASLTRDYAPAHEKKVFFTSIDGSDKRSFNESHAAYADPNFMDFFSFSLVSGHAQTALNNPFSVVLSEATARKYFGDTEVLGNTLFLNGDIPLQITGVFKSLPRNSHLEVDILISSLTIEKSITQIMLTAGGPYCYFKVEPGIDIAALGKKIGPQARVMAADVIKACGDNCDWDYRLQPLDEIAFTSGFWLDQHKPKSKSLLYLLAAIAFVVLFMAWVNYVNLAIAASPRRLKEIAARKTVGARPVDMAKQFFLESAVSNLIALLMATTLVQLARTPLESLFGFYVPDWEMVSASTVLILLCVVLTGIFFTGIYPAWIAIKFSPRDLFARVGSKMNGLALSNMLTPIQFALAIILIVWIFSVSAQIEFILNRDTGYRKNEVLVVDLPFKSKKITDSKLNTLRQEVIALPGVRDFTISTFTPTEYEPRWFVVRKNDKEIATLFSGGVDDRFIPSYDIRIIAGRNFLPDNPTDQKTIILSRMAVMRLGYTNPQDILGEQVSIEKTEWTHHMVPAEVIGVIEDYRVHSFFDWDDQTEGIALTYKSFLVEDIAQPRRISILIESKNSVQTIERVGHLYGKTFEDDLFNWYFLDETLQKVYAQETTVRNQLLLFTGIAIGIACFGLLGMISNKVVQKTKEIGIRKVLGATTHQIAKVLLRATMKQVSVAILIGLPVAHYLSGLYLQKYSERIELQWWHYGLPVAILLTIMLGTVSSVLWRAAKNNPVEALKYE